MKPLFRFSAAVALLTICLPLSNAERIGGPMSHTGVVPPFQSVFLDIPFAEGAPALVAVVGDHRTNLELLLYDGDGNSATGAGFGDRKLVHMDVYRTGTFLVEVRNLGTVPNRFVITTN